MATLLDLSLLNFLLPLFIFLFVFVVVYAILSRTSLFGEKQAALNFIAAFCVAALSVFTGTITGLVSIVTPWIVFMVLILVFLFGIFKFFGMKDEKVWDTIGGPALVYVIILIIILIGMSIVFEEESSPSSDKSVKSEVITALTHPRLLAAIFILVVAAFSVRFLSEKLET